MPGNRSLHAASIAREDEFYTQLNDISNELQYYEQHFEGKTVLCNCDDPYESNFFKYFALKFNSLKLKKLICTCWYNSPIFNKELPLFKEETDNDCAMAAEPSINRKGAYKIELTEIQDLNGDGAADLEDVKLFLEAHKPELLDGTGDFRSEECKELMKEADIVVTNPPFSLFREYVAQLIEYGKKFLIIGNQNAITYKEIFPLIMSNTIWLGTKAGDMSFKVPDYYEPRETRFWIDEDNQKWRSLGNICWYTNLDHNKRHQPLTLYKNYSPKDNPMYDNYDAIEVHKVTDIPKDYDGVMGVPITFLDKYCPEQFEIIKFRKGNDDKDLVYTDSSGKKKTPYFRILIRAKK